MALTGLVLSVIHCDLNRIMSASSMIIQCLCFHKAFLAYSAPMREVFLGHALLVDGLPLQLVVHSSNVLVHDLLRRENAIAVWTFKYFTILYFVEIF